MFLCILDIVVYFSDNKEKLLSAEMPLNYTLLNHLADKETVVNRHQFAVTINQRQLAVTANHRWLAYGQ